MITLKASGAEGSGPGLVRISGSFTTLSNGTPTLIRPSKGNFTITRKAAGVYVITYQQAGLSVVSAGPQINIAASVGTGAVDVQPPGFVTMGGDFMTTNANGTNYVQDTTKKNIVLLCFSSPTSSSLVDVYSLGNVSSVAKYRVSFDICVATSTMNQ